ncbi:MAG: ribosome recycling factor [Bacilli bacterium]|nr:ribosome recycling factor [Bacilli bacterium]
MEEKVLEITETEKEINNVIKKVSDNFGKLRTNLTNQSIFNEVYIDYYGSKTPINQISKILLSGNNLFIIDPYEQNKDILKNISAAISKSNLGFTPNIKDNKIEIYIQPLTTETRKKIVGEAKKYYDTAQQEIRIIRQNILRDLKNSEEYSEDLKKHLQNKIQKIIDDGEEKIRIMFQQKEQNIMKI